MRSSFCARHLQLHHFGSALLRVKSLLPSLRNLVRIRLHFRQDLGVYLLQVVAALRPLHGVHVVWRHAVWGHEVWILHRQSCCLSVIAGRALLRLVVNMGVECGLRPTLVVRRSRRLRGAFVVFREVRLWWNSGSSGVGRSRKRVRRRHVPQDGLGEAQSSLDLQAAGQRSKSENEACSVLTDLKGWHSSA